MEITKSDVLDAVAALPDRDEHMVRLRFWHGHSWDRIALLMGFPHAAEAEAYFEHTVRPALKSSLEETK